MHKGSAHAPLPVIEAFGHELPADEFIAPKRSKMAASLTPDGELLEAVPVHGDGIRAC